MFEAPGGLRPAWDGARAPRVVTTTRLGGLSSGARATLNLGERAGDDPAVVAANRRRAAHALGLPAEPVWLHQVHGATPVEITADVAGQRPRPKADAAWTSEPGLVCAVLTADCLPVVIGDPAGQCVAVVHAGWRGLAAGVIEATLAELPAPSARLQAWLGPAIGPRAFVVGDDVRAAFAESTIPCGAAFRQRLEGGWLADLYELARLRLRAAGVSRIDGGAHCTWHEPERFFSHRRDGSGTGRMATLAWLARARGATQHLGA